VKLTEEKGWGPAIVMNDQDHGAVSQPNDAHPASGAPQPSPPLPFSAPLTLNLANTVMIGARPRRRWVAGHEHSRHVGLHPSDPFMAPPTEMGQIVQGSPTVMFEGNRPPTPSRCARVAWCQEVWFPPSRMS